MKNRHILIPNYDMNYTFILTSKFNFCLIKLFAIKSKKFFCTASYGKHYKIYLNLERILTKTEVEFINIKERNHKVI